MSSSVVFEDIVAVKIDNRGKTPPTVSGGHPLIEVNALVNCGLHPDIKKVSKFVDDETWSTWFRQHLMEGDVVFSTVGTIGETAIVSNDPDYAIAQNILGFRFKKDLVSPLYMLYLMRSSWFIHQITGRTIETVQKSIKWSDMRGIKLDLPSVDTQEKIAKILGDLDRKIELNRRMNETLEQIGQALFKKYFIDNPEREGWESVKIGDLYEIHGGGTPSTSIDEYWKDGDIPWATPTDMTALDSLFINKTSRCVTSLGINNSSAKILPTKSILMTSRATIGKLAISSIPISTNQGFISIVCQNDEELFHLLWWLKANISTVKGLASGSTFPEISRGVFKNIDILKPDKNSLAEFEKNIVPIMKLLQNISFENETLSSVRDSLLPKLMSGEIEI